MEKIAVSKWEWNREKNQLEVVLEAGRHGNRLDVGKQVELRAGGEKFDLGLFPSACSCTTTAGPARAR